jgi:hypothetical protein
MEVIMRSHMKQFTEPIFARLADYRAELAAHPYLTAARAGELERSSLCEFAFYQLADSILWIPMLAQMKSKARRSRRLRRAIEENIGHESGLRREAHVTLAVNLMRSLGIGTLDAFATGVFARTAETWISEEFGAFGEPEVAGWLLVAESLVPLMFADVLPSFARLGCDTRYFEEHVAVDAEEHAAWMREAVVDVVRAYGPDSAEAVVAGMADAWDETLEVPNELWRRRCASH